MNKFIQAYNTNFSLCPCPKNPSQNSSNNITNYLHYPKFYKPPTLSKLHQKKKKYNTSKMLQNQHYNMINHTMPQIPTRSHNTMTMSQHQIFNSKSQILNSTSKFSIPNFQISDCRFAKFQVSNFKIPKFQFSKFRKDKSA